MDRSPRTGIGFALLCLGILGALPILANARPAGSAGLTFAVWLTFWQLVASLPLFGAEILRARSEDPLGRLVQACRGRSGLIALVTGAMFGGSTYMYVVAAERAGPVSLAIALQAYPVFATLVERLFLGKRKSGAELFFTALMIAALVYLTTEGTFRVADISWWTVFALGIPLLWSVAHIMLKRVLETTPATPNQVTVSRLVVSGGCLLVLAVVIGDGAGLLAAGIDPSFQRAAIVMGVAYYLELILWFHAMRHIDVSLASSVTVPAPAVTMLLAVLVLGDSLQTYQLLAMALIAAGMYGLVLTGGRGERTSEPPTARPERPGNRPRA